MKKRHFIDLPGYPKNIFEEEQKNSSTLKIKLRKSEKLSESFFLKDPSASESVRKLRKIIKD